MKADRKNGKTGVARMRRALKRALGGFMSMAVFVASLPAQSLAYVAPGGSVKPAHVVTSGGEALEVEDSWEAQYPYGVFLFDKGEAHVSEGGRE